jgi:hypothetical protein
MNQRTRNEDPPPRDGELVPRLRELGLAVGHPLYRVMVYEDGLVEAEFESHNPWECLVIRYKDPNTLLDASGQDTCPQRLFAEARIRKKCTKCFLHERSATPTEV